MAQIIEQLVQGRPVGGRGGRGRLGEKFQMPGAHPFRCRPIGRGRRGSLHRDRGRCHGRHALGGSRGLVRQSGQTTAQGRHLCLGHRISALVGGQQGFEQIHGGQEGIHHGRPQGQFVLTQPVQEGFQDVGDPGQVLETEGTAGALDGMGGPKNGIELLILRPTDIQAQEQVFHFFQVFGGFVEKHLVELGHINGQGRLPRGPWVGKGRRKRPR